jgi:hypothetical protein
MHIIRPVAFFLLIAAMLTVGMVFIDTFWISLPLVAIALGLTIWALPDSRGESWL